MQGNNLDSKRKTRNHTPTCQAYWLSSKNLQLIDKVNQFNFTFEKIQSCKVSNLAVNYSTRLFAYCFSERKNTRKLVAQKRQGVQTAILGACPKIRLFSVFYCAHRPNILRPSVHKYLNDHRADKINELQTFILALLFTAAMKNSRQFISSITAMASNNCDGDA